MYFVTSKRAGYVLFCMTPSGRAAIGLSEDQKVRLFAREASTSIGGILEETRKRPKRVGALAAPLTAEEMRRAGDHRSA